MYVYTYAENALELFVVREERVAQHLAANVDRLLGDEAVLDELVVVGGVGAQLKQEGHMMVVVEEPIGAARNAHVDKCGDVATTGVGRERRQADELLGPVVDVEAVGRGEVAQRVRQRLEHVRVYVRPVDDERAVGEHGDGERGDGGEQLVGKAAVQVSGHEADLDRRWLVLDDALVDGQVVAQVVGRVTQERIDEHAQRKAHHCDPDRGRNQLRPQRAFRLIVKLSII